MIRLRAIALAILATLASPVQGIERTDWRAELPVDCLAVAVVDSPEATVTQAAKLLEPWGRKAGWLADSFDAAFPGDLFANRPWVVALVEHEAGAVAPLVLAPTDDFAALCEVLSADVADDLAVAVVAGFDVALIDRNGWTQLTLLDTTPADSDDGAASSLAVLDQLAD
ncbi:MAG: hypothetical protein AAF266_14425, partial [Planctomycetota bacterium]